MEHYQVGPRAHYWSPRRKRESGKRNIWRTNDWNFPKFDARYKSRNPNSLTASKINSETHTERHFNQTVKKSQRQREKFNINNREVIQQIWSILNKIISQTLVINLGGQKVVNQYVQSPERKKTQLRPL